MSPSTSHAIPLPKGWPRRIRSAIVQVAAMANVAYNVARAHAEHHFDARVRLQAQLDQRDGEIALLREDARIKDARMESVPAQRRPHYPPTERLAILELRAAAGWSQAETARRFLISPLTIASWTHRLDDEGPDALVQVREPVNRFPELVGYLVQRLKVLCPKMGTRRIADVLARAAPNDPSAIGNRQETTPRLASRSHRRPDDWRLLDSLVAFRVAAALAVLLVGGCRRGSLLASRDGRCTLQERTDRSGDDAMAEQGVSWCR